MRRPSMRRSTLPQGGTALSRRRVTPRDQPHERAYSPSEDHYAEDAKPDQSVLTDVVPVSSAFLPLSLQIAEAHFLQVAIKRLIPVHRGCCTGAVLAHLGQRIPGWSPRSEGGIGTG